MSRVQSPRSILQFFLRGGGFLFLIIRALQCGAPTKSAFIIVYLRAMKDPGGPLGEKGKRLKGKKEKSV